MKPIRLSVNLSKIKGSRLVQMTNADNKKEAYVCVPLSQCFVYKESSDAHLMAMMIETPNSIYSDFVVKEYVPQSQYESMEKDLRMAIPVIGRGRFIVERPNKTVISNTETDVEIEDYNGGDLVF